MFEAQTSLPTSFSASAVRRRSCAWYRGEYGPARLAPGVGYAKKTPSPISRRFSGCFLEAKHPRRPIRRQHPVSKARTKSL